MQAIFAVYKTMNMHYDVAVVEKFNKITAAIVLPPKFVACPSRELGYQNYP